MKSLSMLILVCKTRAEMKAVMAGFMTICKATCISQSK